VVGAAVVGGAVGRVDWELPVSEAQAARTTAASPISARRSGEPARALAPPITTAKGRIHPRGDQRPTAWLCPMRPYVTQGSSTTLPGMLWVDLAMNASRVSASG
jgi:hypothetical protein